MLQCPEDRYYSRRHVWVRADTVSRQAEIGISRELEDRLPEILSLDLPMLGDELEIDAVCIHIHTMGKIKHLPCPLSGRVTAINRDVLDRPDLIHVDPYENWLFQMEYDEEEELDMLFDAEEYMKRL